MNRQVEGAWGVMLVLAGGLASACGGGALTLEQYGARAQDVVCTIEVRCGSLPDKTSCPVFVDLGQAKADVASGKTIFDGTAGAMCLDAIELVDCSRTSLIAQANACQRVATGTLADGYACNAGTQCASRSCTFTPADCDRQTTCCSGNCATTPVTVAEGGDCSIANAQCETGLFCDVGAVIPTCAKRRGLGAACTTLSPCLETLRCVRASGAAEGICSTYPQRGEACPGDYSCNDGLDFCDPTSKTCLARLAVGADCTAAPQGCLGLAFCDETSHKCVAKAAAGQPCAQDDDCLGQLVCGASGACAVPSPRIVCP